MSRNDGLWREVDWTRYGLFIEHMPGKKRPILSAFIGDEFCSYKLKAAEVTDEDELREVMQGPVLR